jgi:sugar phosphate isomerase/epimerase
MCNSVAAGVELLSSLESDRVVLLADLFHMNIEEEDIAAALRTGGAKIGHVHFVDSNRRPAGCGHLDYAPIIDALCDIGYRGYLSAECLPWPDSAMAAKQTIKMFDTLVAC